MNEIKHKIKAIIFDMDGTIIKTEQIWENVTINTLKFCGIKELTLDQKNFIKTLSGVGLSNSTRLLKEQFDLTHSLQEIHDKKIELAEECFEKQIEFVEGFVEFHNKLKQNMIPTSIATNADPSSLKKISQILSLDNFFGQNMYCVADVNNIPKPDPALFLHSASKLGAKPEDCVVFEDSIVGFNAANAAGMKCIGIKNDINQQYLDRVNDLIENYNQAEESLKKISK